MCVFFYTRVTLSTIMSSDQSYKCLEMEAMMKSPWQPCVGAQAALWACDLLTSVIFELRWRPTESTWSEISTGTSPAQFAMDTWSSPPLSRNACTPVSHSCLTHTHYVLYDHLSFLKIKTKQIFWSFFSSNCCFFLWCCNIHYQK